MALSAVLIANNWKWYIFLKSLLIGIERTLHLPVSASVCTDVK